MTPRVYYNEIDRFAAAWLRELMQAGQIPDGEVDEQPAGRRAAERAGIGAAGGTRRMADTAGDERHGRERDSDARGKREPADDSRCGCWDRNAFHRIVGMYPDEVCVNAGKLAESAITGRGAQSERVTESHGWPAPESGRLRAVSELADTVRDAAGQHARELSGDESQHAERTEEGDYRTRDRGAVGELADPDGQRRTRERILLRSEETGRDTGEVSQAPRCGAVGDMGNATRGGFRIDRSASRYAGHVDESITAFWRDADWLPCSDGKARPVEPGTFPLATGVSARVGRLRGYGNSIKPQVAQAFIEAYLATGVNA